MSVICVWLYCNQYRLVLLHTFGLLLTTKRGICQYFRIIFTCSIWWAMQFSTLPFILHVFAHILHTCTNKKNEFWVLYVFQVILINMSSFFEFVSDYDGRLNKAYASTFGLLFRAILHKIHYVQHWPSFYMFLLTFYILALTKKTNFECYMCFKLF